MIRWGRAVVAALIALVASCSREAPARPQLVVVLDTDAVLFEQLAADRALSAQATIDTIRVDVLDGRGGAIDFRDFVAPNLADWPVSFGVAASEATSGRTVHLRVRAFRGALASTGELAGVTTLEPLAELTIDRAVDLTLPVEGDGVVTVRVLLSMDCLGVPPSFLAPARSCIDAARPSELASAGVEQLTEVPRSSRAGTWPRARSSPCRGAPTPDRVCIPGGLDVLGDTVLAGFEDGVHLPAVPMRPVVLSPFFMDRHEMSVGRLRALMRAGKVRTTPKLPNPADVFDRYCTWLGPDDATNDALPVNCVSVETASEACAAEGGRLPTEAEWQHAASGRGDRLRYPWGSESPACCTASHSRVFDSMLPAQCAGTGPEPVGAHASTSACAHADVSRDGVVDLAGSVSELTSDRARPYDHPCWGGRGVLIDPRCDDPTASLRTMRGGEWSAGSVNLLVGLRSGAAIGAGAGFRCVYPDVQP